MTKESLSEYGSGWGWDSNEYAHSFDQTDIDDIPKQYYSNGAQEGICSDTINITSGQLLYSKSQMPNQKSCKPSVGNAGNYYSFSGATAGSNISGGNAQNTICPKGWLLARNAGGDTKSFYNLILTFYSVSDSSDDKIKFLPMSFMRFGTYGDEGSIGSRTVYGFYWSSSSKDSSNAYNLNFLATWLRPQYAMGKGYGFSVRCVSR